ncbi:A/G-specific adenine glycosylase [Dysgonomonas sp. Marseille-P4677]|uniref:A/G-specific adenine glycosylase n=1 Tax=Dysgonomonas sp. Marseille-P4677 TaxID=2364790 RepID=UPI00191250C0|nr:A/G-specific adenine glycosylase [Dysgonomonas sp. Marseille-P4677]MBK5721665.1 A/G-specific adenine glycosylase [Dysgonomonas sp. Marseille-P4677]
MSEERDLRLSSVLIRWYNENKRDLPWRDTTDPYIIWISEIILQQTRVDQGYDYFNRFVNKYPTVDLLATADESDVLKLWQGLGYYSRARNLHAAAKSIASDFDGRFPVDYKDVLKLKGVGEYTAAAIVSFAYNKPYAVVDGNVYRVLSRIFAVDEAIDTTKGKRLFAELAQNLLNESDPGLHNQAVMEFGALQCVPVSPNCDVCPAASMCLAYAQDKVGLYPVKSGKQKTRNRYFNYFDIRYGRYAFLHKRTGKDIWQNLYELPLVETDTALTMDELHSDGGVKGLFGDKNVYIRFVMQMKHVLSHQVIYAVFYQVEMHEELASLEDDFVKVRLEDVEQYPVSRLVHKYLEQL